MIKGYYFLLLLFLTQWVVVYLINFETFLRRVFCLPDLLTISVPPSSVCLLVKKGNLLQNFIILLNLTYK